MNRGKAILNGGGRTRVFGEPRQRGNSEKERKPSKAIKSGNVQHQPTTLPMCVCVDVSQSVETHFHNEVPSLGTLDALRN